MPSMTITAVRRLAGVTCAAALLLSGQEADWTIKKGALWWFTNRVREGETQTVLRTVMPADLA